MPPIKINIVPDEEAVEEEEAVEPKPLQISLTARKTLDGKIMVMDHRDIDIVIDTTSKKIITFPKNEMNDEAYETQDKYFQYLAEKGIVERSSIHGGDVYASIQADYPDADDENVSPSQIVLLSTYKFIEEEKPRFEQEEWLDNEIDDRYVYPTDEDSTELGEVPQEPKKGSIRPYSPNYYNPGR